MNHNWNNSAAVYAKSVVHKSEFMVFVLFIKGPAIKSHIDIAYCHIGIFKLTKSEPLNFRYYLSEREALAFI